MLDREHTKPEARHGLRLVRPPFGVAEADRPLEVPATQADDFRLALAALETAEIPFAIGGGLAIYLYTGAHRQVHDLDIHLQPEYVERAMDALRETGFCVWVHLQPWLAQGQRGDTQIDLIYGQGTWDASVDRQWIERGIVVPFLDREVIIIPPEELLWSKAMRCARVRNDQSDVFHLLVALGPELDWGHLLDRFGPDWEVLLSHLIMFGYVFPSDREAIPDGILDDLLDRLAETRSAPEPTPPICRGQVIDSSGPYEAYATERGYVDERQRRWQRRLAQEPVLDGLTPSEQRCEKNAEVEET